MRTQKLVLAGLVAAVLGSISIPAAARTNVDLYVNIAPPAPRYEVVPAPRIGFVWVPGYWDWRGHRHVWIVGHYARHRPGYYYAPARYVEHEGRWRYYAPGWRPGDRDGDGVPNRFDRAPDNPYIR
jgi:YXWGXW repeat-containing protein